jgi:nucleotide-binding universal stress UspA family protein
MYQKIVLAYDGSLEGRAALREGVILGLRGGSQIHLLAVLPDNNGIQMAESVHAGAVAQQHSSHKAILQEAVNTLKSLGVFVEARLVSGEPAQAIAGYAAKVGADLVIVGHRKQSLLQRWWSGPSGAYLSDHLCCSLLIARKEISQEDFFAEVTALVEVQA